VTLLTSAAAARRCPICGAAFSACGGPSAHHAVDLPLEGRRLMPIEVRVMTGTQGFQTSRKEADEYVKTHPEAQVVELRPGGTSARAAEREANAATEPEPEPTPEPAPEPPPEPGPAPRRRSNEGS
jgi:hypothetical protein